MAQAGVTALTTVPESFPACASAWLGEARSELALSIRRETGSGSIPHSEVVVLNDLGINPSEYSGSELRLLVL